MEDFEDYGPEADDFSDDAAYEEYRDAAEKDGEAVISGRHGGCIYRDESEAHMHPDHSSHVESD